MSGTQKCQNKMIEVKICKEIRGKLKDSGQSQLNR